jgi:hypothetical protein
LNIFRIWKTNSTTTGPKPRSAQWRVAHAHSAGSARLHSGAWPTSERSPLSGRASRRGWRRRYIGGGGANAALEHPRRRGYPPGMGVEAIAHRSSLSTGRERKTGSAAAFSDEARAPVAGEGPTTERREREVGSTLHRRKSVKRSSGSAHRGQARDGGGGRTATVARSDSVGRLRTWTTAQSGRRA